MSLRGTFKTDKRAEVEGVWIEVGMNDHNNLPIEIHISRMSKANKRYTKRLEAVTKPHQSAIQNESLDNDLASKLMQNVFVDTVLLGWKNLPKSELTGNNEDTDDLEFNRANALALFEELPDMYDDWEDRAKKSSAFREAEQDSAAGN
jgi:hypothetical protein